MNIKNLNLKQIAELIHDENVKKGFWDDVDFLGIESLNEIEEKKPTTGLHKVAYIFAIATITDLVGGEIKEAIEALREAKSSILFDKMSAKELEVAKMADKDWFKNNLKDTYEQELIDAMIRLFDLMGYLEIDIESRINEGLTYNSSRAKKHGKLF